ncbi:translin-associated factor [Ophiostoma piceae UAMH 11346]|uniref:Translin-associated factor n=1 Tax=Ophiostoma piceae (strain UAMH 11346) TaxID=1262450 RepID=S3CPM8_OPHP1|nr:translin-associated factor [Ophiostoma piceae UAMH 11346]
MAPEGKRRWEGNGRSEPYSKKPARFAGSGSSKPAAPVVRNQYTSMFEGFRDHMDAHHDRRERVVKASRDITALSKKVIFALQRVRRIHPELPRDVESEIKTRLTEVSRLLAGISPEMQGINRGRYGRILFGMEELMEALTFLHYLKYQTLLSPEDGRAQVEAMCRSVETKVEDKPEEKADAEHKPAETEPTDAAEAAETAEAAEATKVVDEKEKPAVAPDDNDYIMGVFDLSGEMMRFATTSAALRGELAGGSEEDATKSRTIVGDMQELDSFFQMLPQRYDKSWKIKINTLQTSVKKVERLGYDLRVRGSERPKGWVPDAPDADQAPSP